jgi:predicted acetyltransferase
LTKNLLDLPRELGDGLILRWATEEDAEPLALFNGAQHEDENDQPGVIANWTRNLIKGIHPTYRANDFLVVVDQKAENKIVSSVGLMSQEWAYEDIPFKFGQPELVATDPNYRRKGLVRIQFETIHALSAARRELVQGITGIPWYYRQFGYEMTVNLGGGRNLFWHRVGKLGKDEPETYKIRKATETDIPLLAKLYEVNCARSLLKRLRTVQDWKYALNMSEPNMAGYKSYYIFETLEGEPVGYVEYAIYNYYKSAFCREFAVLPGHSLRMVAEFFLRHVKAEAEEISKTLTEPINRISFNFGEEHALYDALGNQAERQNKPYAWYMRVPDLAAFIRHIAPALEKRLGGSVMDGYSGTLKLNFYRQQLALTFAKGKIGEIGTFTPDRLQGGDALFPDLTFLHLLFGHRSIEELTHIYPDISAQNDRAKILLDALFPSQHSSVILLN